MGKNLTIETIFLFFYQSYEKILNDDTVSLLFFQNYRLIGRFVVKSTRNEEKCTLPVKQGRSGVL